MLCSLRAVPAAVVCSARSARHDLTLELSAAARKQDNSLWRQRPEREQIMPQQPTVRLAFRESGRIP